MKMEIPAAIAAERQRQISAEGWDEAHDADHVGGELFLAALCYWQRSIEVPMVSRRCAYDHVDVPAMWPWGGRWWKPKTRSRDLERAGALCMAEIDRLRRLGHPNAHVEATLFMIVQAFDGLSVRI